MKQILNEDDIKRIIDRMAYQIIEKCHPLDRLAFLGVRTRGLPIAERLRAKVEQATGQKFAHGVLDITLYRDDLDTLAASPIVRETDIPFDVSGSVVVLVDDVLFTGRTIRAALDQIVDFGRPLSVRLAALIDRGGREFPIQADFVGKKVRLLDTENSVSVKIKEIDNEEGVFLV